LDVDKDSCSPIALWHKILKGDNPMQFKVEGLMDVVAPVAERRDGFLKTERFSVEVVADSEEEALQRA